MDLKIIPTEEVVKDNISLRLLKDKPKDKVEYKAPQIELSKNIQKFDHKPKVITENPYSFNSVSLKKKEDKSYSPSAYSMLTDPTYNTVGKVLGVDTVHDWNKYYDKIYAITEWAKKKSGTDKLNKLVQWISNKGRSVPNLGNKIIDNLYIYAKLQR